MSSLSVCSLTQQEQVLAQSQGGWLSPREAVVSVFGSGGDGVGNDSKTVDILQMLSKARTEYDKVCTRHRSILILLLYLSGFVNFCSDFLLQEKCTTEPKEIGGSSVLCGNPNLIKPIPVKPSTQVKHPVPVSVDKNLCCLILFSFQLMPASHHLLSYCV